MLWLPLDRGPLDLWLTPCHPRVSRESVSTDQPTLVAWLRQDPPVQLTDPAGHHPTAMLGSAVYYRSYKHQERTVGATTPGSCSAPATPWAHVSPPVEHRWVAGGRLGWFWRLMPQSGNPDSALRARRLAARPAGAVSEAQVNDYTIAPRGCRELGLSHPCLGAALAGGWPRRAPMLGLRRWRLPTAGPSFPTGSLLGTAYGAAHGASVLVSDAKAALQLIPKGAVEVSSFPWR